MCCLSEHHSRDSVVTLLLGARLTLRNGIKLQCRPFDGDGGIEKDLSDLPAKCSWHNLVARLSSLQWDKDRVGRKCPTLDAEGRIDVQKVYYTAAVNEKRPRTSCSAPTHFPKFVEWCDDLPGNAVVTLILWDNAEQSPPHSPSDGASQNPTKGMYRSC